MADRLEAEREARETALAGHRMSAPRPVGKRDEDSPPFGFHAWDLPSERKFHKLIKKMIREGVELATEDYQAFAEFTVDMDERKGLNDHPLTFCVDLPLGDSEGASPRWIFNIKDMVEYMVAGHEAGAKSGAPIYYEGDDPRPGFAAMRDRLRELADYLDEVLARPPG